MSDEENPTEGANPTPAKKRQQQKKKKGAKEPVAEKPKRKRKSAEEEKRKKPKSRGGSGYSTLLWVAGVGLLLAIAAQGWQQNWLAVRTSIAGVPDRSAVPTKESKRKETRKKKSKKEKDAKDMTREEIIAKAEELAAKMDAKREAGVSGTGGSTGGANIAAAAAAGSKLHEAALAGDAGTIASLAKEGADLDKTVDSGDTAATMLVDALSRGEVEAETAAVSMMALGKAGANLNKAVSVSVLLGLDKKVNKYPETVLHMLINFVERGRISGVAAATMVAALAEGGADTSLVDEIHKDTALHRAVLSRRLIGQTTTTEPTYADGHEGQVALVTALASAPGANFALFDNYGLPVIHRAAHKLQGEKGETTVVILKMLVGQGADPNASDLAGKPAMHHAAGQGNTAIVRAMIAAGFGTEAKDRMQMTALFHAIFASKEETVKVLIKAGANLEAKSKSKQTLVDVAEHVGNDEVTYILLKAMAEPAWKEIRLTFPGNAPIKDVANMTEVELKQYTRKKAEIARGRKMAKEIREDMRREDEAEEEEAAAAAAASAAATEVGGATKTEEEKKESQTR